MNFITRNLLLSIYISNKNICFISIRGGCGGCRGGADVSNFFYYESKFKIKNIFFGRGGGGGARVSELLFTKNPNLKKIFFFCRGGGGGGVGGRGWRGGEGGG